MDISAWPGLALVEQIDEGNRNTVWKGDLAGQAVSVRQSRRSPESLQWEVELLRYLLSQHFRVPVPLPTARGEMHRNGIVVQQWLPGVAPESPTDWALVAQELARLHAATHDYPQRPGCCAVTELETHRRSVDADLDAMPESDQQRLIDVFATVTDVPQAVVHGDVHSSNIRIDDGIVGLLDWDETRVDVIWHDLSNLGTTVLAPDQDRTAKRVSNAWEAVNGWICEPAYARRRLAALDDLP